MPRKYTLSINLYPYYFPFLFLPFLIRYKPPTKEAAENLLKRRPEAVIERAVKGMLPKNRLGRQMYKKLFVYAGAEHPHSAQQPKELKFEKIK